MAKVLRMARIALTVSDLERACAFYSEGLGFAPDGIATQTGEGASRARSQAMSLGAQAIALVAYAVPGAPYPEPRRANDPWFQHFAIAVSDMDAAYTRLSAQAQQPISRGGPQRLPPSTGSVTAYKFRDPDGHPLELSLIPDSAWSRLAEREALAERGAGETFLGVDHCAIAVADLEASLAFYVGMLGMEVAGRGVNRGPAQDRLDGLDGVALDIVAVQPVGGGPHIELLHYRSPSPLPARDPVAPADAAATRLIFDVEDLQGLRSRLAEAGAQPLAPPPSRDLRLRDPDGHLLDLRPA